MRMLQTEIRCKEEKLVSLKKEIAGLKLEEVRRKAVKDRLDEEAEYRRRRRDQAGKGDKKNDPTTPSSSKGDKKSDPTTPSSNEWEKVSVDSEDCGGDNE